MTANPTRSAIMAAAEALFVENGFNETSLRQITAKANVNLAAVNYHFGSKEVLIEEILKKHLSELNEKRKQALAQLQEQAQGQTLKPTHIIIAFFGTMLEQTIDKNPKGDIFLRLLGRVYSSPNEFIRILFAHEYQDVFKAYLEAFSLALPNVPRAEIIWRLEFMVGAIAYAFAGTDSLSMISEWAIDESEDAQQSHYKLHDRLMAFLLGGFRAPLPEFPNSSTK